MSAPAVPRQVSAVRLAVARRAMQRAVCLEDVVAAKDAAKGAGLAPRDLEALRVDFVNHLARFKRADFSGVSDEQG